MSESLSDLVKKWLDYRAYTDNADYGDGLEDGHKGAAYDLEQWMRDNDVD